MTGRRRTGLALAACLVVGFAGVARAQDPRCDSGAGEVRRVAFEGNRAFDDRELERVIATSASGLARRAGLPFGTRRCVDRGELANDRLRLLAFYRNRGFSEVTVEAKTRLMGGTAVEVRFEIAEGPPTVLRSLVVTGLEGVRDRQRVTRGLPIRSGDRLDRARLNAAIDTITSRLRNAGYPRAEARHRMSGDSAARTAHDTIVVTPGPFTRIGSIELRVTPLAGRRQKISDRVVRRIVAIDSGDVFSERALVEAQRRLYLTDAYRQVSIRADTSVSADSLADVTVLLSEDAMRAARLGAGYGTLDCFRASGELTHYNFLSGARRVELTARVSKIGIGDPLDGAPNLCPQARRDPYSSKLNYYAGATLRQPVVLGFRGFPTLTVYSGRVSEFKAYMRTTTIGGIATVDWRRRALFPTTLAYQLDYGRTEAQPALFCAVFNRCDREERERLQAVQRIGTASVTVARTTADNLLAPRRGSTWRFEARHASRLTLADSGLGFSKLLGDAARYWAVGSAVLAVRLRAGGLFSSSFGHISGFVPPEERLFAGGPTTVRGFPQNELGSVIYLATQIDTLYPPATGGDTLFQIADRVRAFRRAVPVGGNTMFVGNVELRMRSPVLPEILQVTLFTDVGEVWNRGKDDVFQNFRLKATPGIQIGGTSPVGLVRMVIGYNPYDRPSGPVYFEQSAAEGGGLPCVSPENGLAVHGRATATGIVLEQIAGRCPATFSPAISRSFRSRLTLSFAIGQAF